MIDVNVRDLEYGHASSRMRGVFCAPGEATRDAPGVLMVHGGFGLVPRIVDNARELAAAGYAVLAVDMWGERRLPRGPSEFVGLIEELARDRATWMGRLDAACDVLVQQHEVAVGPIGALGYCFGGSTVLEYARTGRDVAAAISVHGGLDTVASGWSACRSTASVLILTGSQDAMATEDELLALQHDMTAAGVDWQTSVYSGTDHAFTFPDSPNWHARSDQRARSETMRLLSERLPTN